MRILRMEQVRERTGLARSTVYKYMQEGLFPLSVQLGPNATGWVEQEVVDWIEERIAERNASACKKPVA